MTAANPTYINLMVFVILMKAFDEYIFCNPLYIQSREIDLSLSFNRLVIIKHPVIIIRAHT